MGRLADYIQREFGFDLVAEFPPKVVSIGSTPTELVKGNPDRVMLLIQNIGAEDAYIHFDQRVSTSLGLLVPKNGGGWVFLGREDGEIVGYPWYAITGTSTTLYLISIRGR